MFRIATTLRLIPESFQLTQTVRWARKPRKPIWMPTAPSKLYRIPKRIKFPQEEEDEVRRLFNLYRTAMKSIRRYLTYRYSVLLQAKSDTEQLKKAAEEDFIRCSNLNDKWNEQVKMEREKRVQEELEKELEFARNRKEELLRLKEQEFQFAEEIVRKEKEAAQKFITPEMLDEVIEKAINNPIDYNFSVDLEGNRCYGRDTKPNTEAK